MEQVGVALDFFAFYVANKIGKTGLTDVTVDVYKRDGTKIVTNGAATALGGGLYRYTMAANLNTAEDMYVAIFKTADATVDPQHVPSMWPVGKGGVENLTPAAGAGAAGTPPVGNVVGDWWWKRP